MQKHENGDVTLKREEVQSLRKVLHACSWAISDLPSGGNLIGYENDYALGMWEDKLKGNTSELSYYIGNNDEDEYEYEESGKEGNEQFAETPKKPTTVDEWLFDYGAGYQ